MGKEQEKSEIIEQTGLLFESLGTTRMSGRILGFLMTEDKSQLSFEEFTRGLRASKSTISTNLRALHQLNYIKQVSLPGDRKTYYTLNNEISWTDSIKARSGALAMFVRLFSQAMDLRMNAEDNSGVWLRKARKFYEFSGKMVPVIIEEWKKVEAEDT
ncbi:MAG: MarR family transcriptional regulator [Lentimicrobium sp.]|nr:MarR family transcriptional regulator [Lentimicrobium sp.]